MGRMWLGVSHTLTHSLEFSESSLGLGIDLVDLGGLFKWILFGVALNFRLYELLLIVKSLDGRVHINLVLISNLVEDSLSFRVFWGANLMM